LHIRFGGLRRSPSVAGSEKPADALALDEETR
jgi:hypothetical protein